MRILLALPLTLLAASASAKDVVTYGQNPADLIAHLDRLVAAYPDVIVGYDDTALILNNGVRLPLSDGRTDKTPDELLDEPDIGDMFAFPYPADAPAGQPPRDFDPGRIRVEPLFRALYGDCQKEEMWSRMRSIAWVPAHGGGTVSITTMNGADKALEAVSQELDKLPKAFGKYLVPLGGTYNCRLIAGTSRMSMHAYGAAIDLNTKYSAYWRWQKPGADGLYKWTNQIPPEIVAIFEKHGFVWGGRWYHFDTMHFEYRPELVVPTK
ncbi:MAG TPA: M15 family metallopeptidase [Rhizobiaceae bacterium]|nr:M15 family metallopeptidase [Rhizobiaceae bacterium]